MNFVTDLFRPGGPLDMSGEYCCKCGGREKLIKLKDRSLCYQHYPVYGKKELLTTGGSNEQSN